MRKGRTVRRFEIPVDQDVNLDQVFQQNQNERDENEFVEVSENERNFDYEDDSLIRRNEPFDRRICIGVRITIYDNNPLLEKRVEELKKLIAEKFVILTERFGYPRKRRSNKSMIYLTIVHKDEYEFLRESHDKIEQRIREFKQVKQIE